MLSQDRSAVRTALNGLVVTAMLLGAAITLSACNTTAGAGQDVSAAGHAVTNTADKVKTGL